MFLPKYGNRKVTVDGITFDSVKESRRYQELVLLQKAGKISCLELQKVFILAPSVVLNGRRKPELKYKADFYYLDRSTGFPEEVVEDTKSKATAKLPAFRIKAHLMKHIHGLDIVEV